MRVESAAAASTGSPRPANSPSLSAANPSASVAADGGVRCALPSEPPRPAPTAAPLQLPSPPPRPPRAAARAVPPPALDEPPSAVYGALVATLSSGLSEACAALMMPHCERPPAMHPGHWAASLWLSSPASEDANEAVAARAEPLAEVMALQRRAVLGVELELRARLSLDQTPASSLPERLRRRIVQAFAQHVWTSWIFLRAAIARTDAPLTVPWAERLVRCFCAIEPDHPELITAVATVGRQLGRAISRPPWVLGALDGLGPEERSTMALAAVSETLVGLGRAHRGMAMRLLRVGGRAMIVHAPNTFAQLNKVLLRPFSHRARAPLERVLATVLSAPVDGGSRQHLHEQLSLNMWLTAGVSLMGRIDEPTLLWFDATLGRLEERLSRRHQPLAEPDLLFFALAALNRMAESQQDVALDRPMAPTAQAHPQAVERKLACLRLLVGHALFFMPYGTDVLQAAEILRLIARLHGTRPQHEWPPLSEPLVQLYEQLVAGRSGLRRQEGLQRFIERLAVLDGLVGPHRRACLRRWLEASASVTAPG